MKQILQDLYSGETKLADVPVPSVRAGRLLIRTRVSLVSPGTERMLVDFGRAGLMAKARQQPEKVRAVLDKMLTDGLLSTLEAVRSKLDQPLSLGYCNVGVAEAVGPGVDAFAEGERVASNGSHAEMVSVPHNLCARIPDAVSDEQAAFTVIGAIALQGVRLARPTLGECFVVTGLGLIGLVTIQLLRANGCRVLGIDPDPGKTEIARRFGVETVELSQGQDPVSSALLFSRGRGVDGVLLTLSAKGSEPVGQAARMCRKRGRVVLVGVTGLELNRSDFYEKELSFQVSCSYGPGRHDPAYEEHGQDYPVGFVRWTEQRNCEAVLDMLAAGRLDVKPLITHRFSFEDAPKAYDLLTSDAEVSLGILLEYGGQLSLEERKTAPIRVEAAGGGDSGTARTRSGKVTLGVIGAGNYAGRVLIPNLASTGAKLQAIASQGGVTASHFGRKFGFEEITTDANALIADQQVNAVVVATRHDSHASYVCKALQAGKHVFVEKPLALTSTELDSIERVWANTGVNGVRPLVMVGFNRRFAPQVKKMKALLAHLKGPKSFIVTVNAGEIPADHWTQDSGKGGGRIIGEGCHFVDLLRFLASAPVTCHSSAVMKAKTMDTATIQLGFADGSIGTIHYFANGHRSLPKERLEVFAAGRILQLDNFRKLVGHGWPGFRKMILWRQDKGQKACAQSFIDAVSKGAPSPIPFEELIEVSRVMVELRVSAEG